MKEEQWTQNLKQRTKPKRRKRRETQQEYNQFKDKVGFGKNATCN